MKNIKYASYNDIGTIVYRKNPRARNISIRINREGEVSVTVPAWCSYHKAELFVYQKKVWIQKKLQSIKRKSEQNLVWEEGDIIQIFGGRIEILSGDEDDFSVLVNDNIYFLHLPANFDIGSRQHQEALFKKIKSLGLKAARDRLPAILKKLASDHKFSFEKVSIRQMRSRWGSCSAKNRISLSSALIFLPFELIEYVCLHELVHTVHKNHSHHFWQALEKELPDMMERRKKLRQQTLMA